MSTIKDGGQAFPLQPAEGYCTGDMAHGSHGMTLRDYFASHATPLDDETSDTVLAGLTGLPKPHAEQHLSPAQWVDRMRWFSAADAAYRYMQADAMLAARGRGGV